MTTHRLSRRVATSLLLTGLFVLATASRPLTAMGEVSDSTATAKAWQKAAQVNERSLASALRDAFNHDDNATLRAGVKRFAGVVLTEIKGWVDAGVPGVAEAVIGSPGMGRFLPLSGALPTDPKALAQAKLSAALSQVSVPVEALGDLLWLHNFCVAGAGKAASTASTGREPTGEQKRAMALAADMFAQSAAIGSVPATSVWTPGSGDVPGRQRVTSRDAGYAELRALQLKGDVDGLQAGLRKGALASYTMRRSSVLYRMSRAFGLMPGGELSGSSNVYLWQMRRASAMSDSAGPLTFLRDPIWNLIPIVTMVVDDDHTILEVAMVLQSWSTLTDASTSGCAYTQGDYGTLITGSRHDATELGRVQSILTTHTVENLKMLCWYGAHGAADEGKSVVACRRSETTATNKLKPFLGASAYEFFFAATMDTDSKADGVLNKYGFPKAKTELEAKWGPTGTGMNDAIPAAREFAPQAQVVSDPGSTPAPSEPAPSEPAPSEGVTPEPILDEPSPWN